MQYFEEFRDFIREHSLAGVGAASLGFFLAAMAFLSFDPYGAFVLSPIGDQTVIWLLFILGSGAFGKFSLMAYDAFA